MSEMRPNHPEFSEAALKDREDAAFSLLRDNLPAGAITLYSPRLLDNRVRERSPDFIVLHPDFGAAILEVKAYRRDGATPGDASYGQALKKAENYITELLGHLEREFGGDPEIFSASESGKGVPVFPASRFIVFMGASEKDRDALLNMLDGAIRDTDILTEETLRNAPGLQARLRGKALPNAVRPEVLRKIADAVIPVDATTESVGRNAARRRKDLLPRAALYQFSLPEDGGDPNENYEHLKSLLAKVCDDAGRIVGTDRPKGAIATKIDQIRDDITADRFRLGLFGHTGAGKSTFINAFFGKKLLQSGLGTTTKTLTRIMRPDGGHGDGEAIVRFKTWDELNLELHEYVGDLLRQYMPSEGSLRLVDFGGEASPDISDPATFELVKRILAEAPEQSVMDDTLDNQKNFNDKIQYLKELARGWPAASKKMGTTVTMSLDASTELCGSEDNAIFIRERDIYLDNPFTSKDNIIFVDTPGFGSNLERHTRLAVDTAVASDAVVMLTPVNTPVMKGEKDFFLALQNRQPLRKMDNLVYIVNKIGEIKMDEMEEKGIYTFDESVDYQHDVVKRKIQDVVKIADPELYLVDAYCALQAQLAMSGDERAKKRWETGRHALVQGDPEANLHASRMPDMIKKLRRRLQANKIVDFLGSKQTLIKSILDIFQSDIRKEIDGMDKELEQIRDNVKRHEDSRKVADRKITEALNHTIPSKVEKALARMDADIDKFVEKDIVDIIIRHVQSKYTHFLMKIRGAKSTDSVWHQLMSDPSLLEQLGTAIGKKRLGYHEQYAAIREENRQNLIEDVLAAYYGEKLTWNFPYSSVEIRALASVSSIRDLRPTGWQDFKLTAGAVGSYIASLFGGSGFDLEKWRNEFITENYREKCKEAIKTDIVEWIRRDSDHFKEMSQKSFRELMDAIEEGLTDCLSNHDDKKTERDARQENLEHYRREIDVSLENLRDLDKAIKKLNP